MENRIAAALSKLFERHRIVFWYDEKNELRLEYECLDIEGVEKIEIRNNEFGIKYRVLREQPDQKFLIYKDGPQPEDIHNWLLDIQLANGEFRADQARIWLSELDLGPQFEGLIQEHAFFFQSVKRRESLRKLLQPRDTATVIRTKMLAICAASDPHLEEILQSLLAELAEGKSEKIVLVQRAALEGFLLDQLNTHYGYESDAATLKDFSIELFKSCYAMATGGGSKLRQDAILFLKRWMDSRQYGESFNKISESNAEFLDIEETLATKDFRDLLDLDYFRLIDKKIISDLVDGLNRRILSTSEVSAWTKQRRNTHWYSEYEHVYEAIDSAAQFIQTLEHAVLTMDSLEEGIQRYTRSWFRLDQLYRKYVFHAKTSGQVSLLDRLNEEIENRYTNKFLLVLNDAWQNQVDKTQAWESNKIPSQRTFFSQYVNSYLSKDNKVYVIISDALRFEIAEELSSLIRMEDRYEATLEPLLGVLPSYTQLGMAALLPNNQIEISDGDSGTVLVDGQSSQGTANRAKILAKILPKIGLAIQAEEVLNMTRDDSRALVRDNDVVYVYHNRIDTVGDKRDSEERVFEATEDALEELKTLIKKLTSANATNLIITSDHGFIYQNRRIDESDFATEDVIDGEVYARDRRYVLGRGLNTSASMKTFAAKDLGLSGEFDILIPKSINRLRVKGSGSRYVHGGASLQEVVIPVLRINKKRESDVSIVDVDILPGATSVISSGQLTVTMFQSDPTTEKMHGRNLRAGIYTKDGVLISDSHQLAFDNESGHSRDREQKIRFILSRDAEKMNGQEVELRLEEKVDGTSHYNRYKTAKYTLRRSFTSDFDL